MSGLGYTGKGMSPELAEALERCRGYVMTPEEKFEQSVSFVYGQQDYDNPNPKSKDEIRQMMIDHQGFPQCPKCAVVAVVTPQMIEAGCEVLRRHLPDAFETMAPAEARALVLELRRLSLSQGQAERPSASENVSREVITPSMIETGEAIIRKFADIADPKELALRVYAAMWAVRDIHFGD